MYLSCLLVNVGMSPDQPRPGREWLGNVYAVHQRLCMAFPDQARRARDPQFLMPQRAADFAKGRGILPGRNATLGRDGTAGLLFRIDHQPSGAAAILALSTLEPDWHYAFQNAGMLLAAPPQVKPYQPRFQPGDRLRFKTLLNLSKRSKEHAKRVAFTWDKEIKPDDAARAWLQAKADVRAVLGGEPVRAFTLESCALLDLGWVAGYKPRPRGQDGALPTPGPNHKVQHDTLRFRSALLEGVLRVEDAAAFTRLALGGIGAGKAFGFGLLSLARLP